MAGDQTRAVRPITDFIDLADIPLAEYLPIGGGSVLASILVTDAWTDLGPDSFTLSAEFNLGGLTGLHLPGLSQFSLSFNADGFATGTMVCGPEPSIELADIEINLTIDPAMLRARDGTGAKISARCGVRLDRDGFRFLTFGGASLPEALVAGTDVEISLADITLGDAPDEFLRVATGTLTLPMFASDDGVPLELVGTHMTFGRDGPGGRFSKAGGSPVDLKLGDFNCRMEEAEIALEHGQLAAVKLSGQLDLGKFLAAGRNDSWVSVDFSVGPEGVMAALSDDEPIIDMTLHRMFYLAVDHIRLESAGAGTLWLSGSLTPHIAGVEGGWPTFAFDEIGISAGGGLRLAQGASVATTQPFVLNWNFLRLTVTAFSLERPEGAPKDLELRLSASLEIVEGIPAGASVEGLVARRCACGAVDVRFDGIGIRFGTPGAYDVAASIAWDDRRKALSGSGHLDVSALDLRLDVVFASAAEKVGDAEVTTVFVAAESSLIPGGIPIAATGLSLYGVSGLLAHNLALTLPNEGPRRYFDAFQTAPQGFASPKKWHASAGAHTLGLGVVIGTADDGWLLSARGGLLLSVEDLTLLVVATAELLHERQPMSSMDQGKLAAVLAVHPASGLFRVDFEANWRNGDLFELEAEGGAEFHDGSPLGFSAWLGRPPEEGKPVRARSVRVGKSWLLTSDYWFGFDAARAVKLGMRSQLELRAGGGGLYAELVASAEARAGLCWNPDQLEGAIALSGRARLMGGGLSLCLSLSAGITVAIARPTTVEIPLKACIEIDWGLDTLRLCLHYTFAWRNEVPPSLDPLLQGLTLVPRHWKPRSKPTGEVDDGIVGHVSTDCSATIDLGEVQPHSELVLEASKSLLVELPPTAPVKLNDVAVPLPQPIGDRSGWLTQWSLAGLSLIDQTDGGRQVDLFGTFSRSPLAREIAGQAASPRPANTELRLLSSRRFGQEGSLGGGGAEGTPALDCGQKPTRRRSCISLSGLAVGGGRLANGWIYTWEDFPFLNDRDNRYGVALGPEDQFKIFPPEGVDAVELKTARRTAGAPAPGTEVVTPRSVVHPEPVKFTERSDVLLELCWEELVPASATSPASGWTGSSGDEEWTLAAAKRLLVPGHEYTLDVGIEGRTLRGTRQVGPVLATTRSYRFRAGRAPHWRDALVRAVAGIYPADGVRPAFRDHDMMVHFHDDYIEALYALDRRTLGVRLRDSDGQPVVGPDGPVLLPTRWEDGPISRAPVERWWGAARANDPGSRCEAGPPPHANGPTVLPIAMKDLNLRPLTRYSAELVAVDNGGTDPPTDALATWSFTTSRFEDFGAMARMGAPAAATGLIAVGPPEGMKFDALVRSFGAPPVTAVERTRMTPVRSEEHVSYLLIEAPEPLDDTHGRLMVEVETHRAQLIANLDATRVVAVLAKPMPVVAPDAAITVQLTWRAAPGSAPEARRSVRGVATDTVLQWQVPMSGVSS